MISAEITPPEIPEEQRVVFVFQNGKELQGTILSSAVRNLSFGRSVQIDGVHCNILEEPAWQNGRWVIAVSQRMTGETDTST